MDPFSTQNLAQTNIGPLVSGIGQLNPLPTASKNPTVVTSQPATDTLNAIKGNTNTIQSSVQTQAQNRNQNAAWAAVGAQNQQQYDAILAQSKLNNQTAADNADKQAKAIKDATDAVNGTTSQGMTGQQFLNTYSRAPTADEIASLKITNPIDTQGAPITPTGTTDSTNGGTILPSGITRNANGMLVNSNGDVVGYNQAGTNYNSDGTVMGSPPTSSQGTSSGTDFSSKLNSVQDQIDKASTQFQTTYNQILNGTFPLNSTQQALLDSTKSMYDQAIKAQLQANEAYSEGTQVLGLRAGGVGLPSEMAGSLYNAASVGAQKIASLDSQASQALAKLNQGFMSDDATAVKDAYDELIKTLDSKTTEINKMQDTATAAAKDARDFIQTNVTTPINTIATDAAKGGAPASVISAISSAKTVQDAINAAGDYLQTATGQVGDYLQYKRDTIAAGKVPEDYMTFKSVEDQKAAQIDIQKASAIAYATARAKASADAASGVLNSQQNSDVNAAQTQLNGSQETKDLSNITSALSGIKGIPVDTTDPTQQKALVFALARALVPGANSVRGAISALDPNGLNSDAYNLLKSAEGTFSSSGKAKLSESAVTSIFDQIQQIQKSAVENYTTKRDDMIKALDARVPNSAQYLPDFSDSGSLSTADKLNAISDSVTKWASTAPEADYATVKTAAQTLAKQNNEADLQPSEYAQLIQSLNASGKIKTPYTSPI